MKKCMFAIVMLFQIGLVAADKVEKVDRIEKCDFRNLPSGVRVRDAHVVYDVENSVAVGKDAKAIIGELKQNPQTVVNKREDRFGNGTFYEFLLSQRNTIDHNSYPCGPCSVDVESLNNETYCSYINDAKVKCETKCIYHWTYDMPGSFL